MDKVQLDAIRPWVEEQVTDLLGFEDDEEYQDGEDQVRSFEEGVIVPTEYGKEAHTADIMRMETPLRS